MESLFLALFIICILLMSYHLVIFPIGLKVTYKLCSSTFCKQTMPQTLSKHSLPLIEIVVPIHNEQVFLEKKLTNLQTLVYPADKLLISIYNDGSNDQSIQSIKKFLKHSSNQSLDIRIIEEPTNKGKVYQINKALQLAKGEILLFSDASALLSETCLEKIAQHFQNQKVGIVCGTYKFDTALGSAEEQYWHYQTRIKEIEATFGSPIGCHGSGYAVRRSLAEPILPNTINDDFMLPMQIIAKGYQGIYDRTIISTELQRSTQNMDWQRRQRIAAGNIDQLRIIQPLLKARRWSILLLLLSGKVLRALLPVLLVAQFLLVFFLAIYPHPWFKILFLLEFFVIVFANMPNIYYYDNYPKIIFTLNYIFNGVIASLIGIVKYYLGCYSNAWGKLEG